MNFLINDQLKAMNWMLWTKFNNNSIQRIMSDWKNRAFFESIKLISINKLDIMGRMQIIILNMESCFLNQKSYKVYLHFFILKS